MKSSDPCQTATPRPSNLDEALARIRQAKLRRLLGHGLGAAAVAGLGTQGLTACAIDAEEEAVSQEQPATDWTRDQGKRDTSMVHR